MFNQGLPLFICIVNREELELKLYSTATRWFLLTKGANLTKAVFKLRTDEGTFNDRINGFANEEEKIIDLGLPIITLNNDDFKKRKRNKLKYKKDLLKEAIRMEQFNISLFQQGVPYFVWFEQIITNKSVKKAWCAYGVRVIFLKLRIVCIVTL